MSNQVGDCFKFLWPFHNVRTLTRMFNTKLKIQLSDWYDIQNLIDSYELIRREKLNLKVKVCVASMLLKHFFSNKEENQLAKWSILLYVYYIISYRKKSKYLQKKSLIFLEWSLWFSRMWEKKPNCNTYISTYLCQTVQSSWKAINQLHLPEWSQLSKRIIIRQKASLVSC